MRLAPTWEPERMSKAPAISVVHETFSAAGCPDAGDLAGYFEDELPADDRAVLSLHLKACEQCRDVLALLQKASPTDTLAPPTEVEIPRKGDVIGRYVVIQPCGTGAMGFVMSAHDTQLDRDVALKLVRADVTARGGA